MLIVRLLEKPTPSGIIFTNLSAIDVGLSPKGSSRPPHREAERTYRDEISQHLNASNLNSVQTRLYLLAVLLLLTESQKSRLLS